VPFVLDMVDVDSAKWSDLAKKRRAPLSWLYRREARTLGAFETRIVTAARSTLVVNEREALLLRDAVPGARVLALENGIEVDVFRNRDDVPAAARPTVVFCGVMNYFPNEEGVRWFSRDVWPLIRQRHPGAQFLVVGASPSAAVLRLSEQDPSIVVTGRVPDVVPYLWQSWVSVAPLHTARGVQNKVLEGMALGMPVVVSGVAAGGIDGLRGDELLVRDEPEEWIESVGGLLDDAAARAALGARVRRMQADLETLATTRERYREAVAQLELRYQNLSGGGNVTREVADGAKRLARAFEQGVAQLERRLAELRAARDHEEYEFASERRAWGWVLHPVREWLARHRLKYRIP
jgi:sugar transferase (PEP-CTERM/EpsH1 system associated)